MIDLDDVLAHAHDNCAVCEGTGVVRCWSPGGPCPDGQTVCESCGPCQQSDVPALVAALREARAEVERLTEQVRIHAVGASDNAARLAQWEADFPCDGACRDYPEETCSRHGRRPADLWDRSDQAFAERDDWQRRYEALRDGVTGLHQYDYAAEDVPCSCGVLYPCPTAAVVARVEES